MKYKSPENQRPTHSKVKRLAGNDIVTTAIVACAVTNRNQNETNYLQ